MTLRVFLWTSCSFGGPQSFFQNTHGLCPMLCCGSLHLFHPGVGWRFSEDNYTKLLSGSIRKCILRMSAFPWDHSQFGQVLVWTLPHSLLHLFACISCRQDKFWLEIIFVQFVTLTLHWEPCLAAGCGLFRVHISLLCISTKIIPIDSLLPSLSGSVAHSKDACTLSPLTVADFNTFSWHYGPSFSFTTHLPYLPFPFLNNLQFQSFFLDMNPMTALFPLLSEVLPCSF